MNCNANHLINAALSLSAYDAAPILEVFAVSAGDQGPVRDFFSRNEAKKPHWRYRKRRFAQKTDPNEPKTDPPHVPSGPRQPRQKPNEPTAAGVCELMNWNRFCPCARGM